jgi:uracil-DNA glycosylase
VKPKVLVALGATAAQSLLGRQFRVTKQRGVPIESDLAPYVVATVHPSSILRQETEEDRAEALRELIADLKVVAKLLGAAA